MTQPSGQPAIRVKICRAGYPNRSVHPVTVNAGRWRAVTIPRIYFQRNIGLSFNDRTGILHGTPTEYGEFPVLGGMGAGTEKRFSPQLILVSCPPCLLLKCRGISGSALFLS